jgi:hypothetical protein
MQNHTAIRNFSSLFRKYMLYRRHPALAKEALRGRHETWCGMRWTRLCRKTCGAVPYGQAVWFWLPDAGVKSVLAMSASVDTARRRWWLTITAHQEEHGASVKPLRRECRTVSAYLCWPACVFFCFARKAVGAASTRHSLLPLLPRDKHSASLGRKSRRGNAVLRLLTRRRSNEKLVACKRATAPPFRSVPSASRPNPPSARGRSCRPGR